MKKRKLIKGEFTHIIILNIVSVIALVLSLQMFLEKPSLSASGAVPLLVSIIMTAMSILMLLELRGCERAFTKEDSLVTRFKATFTDLFPPSVAIILLYVVIYAALLQLLGFTVSTFLFLAASMITLNRAHIIKTLIISAGILIGILIIFQYMFQVVLP